MQTNLTERRTAVAWGWVGIEGLRERWDSKRCEEMFGDVRCTLIIFILMMAL